jgi:glycosyltransferase involved in cell wall biosynthesis
MNILMVLSQRELTGAEVYATELVRFFPWDYKVIFVSDTLTRRNNHIKFYQLPIDRRNKSYLGRFLNILRLKEIIQKEGIDIIHTHSRASAYVSFFVNKLFYKSRIPIVSTVHGMLPVHFSSILLPCLGKVIIATSEMIKDHLIRDFRISQENIRLVRYGVDTKKFNPINLPKKNNHDFLFTFIGRLSGPKAVSVKAVIEAMQEILNQKERIRLRIVGGGESLGKLKELARRIIPDRQKVIFTEFKDDIKEELANANVVIGAGQVVLEAGACAKPVVVIGERRFIGLLSDSNFKFAMQTNFGDHYYTKPKGFDIQEIRNCFKYILKIRNNLSEYGKFAKELIDREYCLEKITSQIISIYKECITNR